MRHLLFNPRPAVDATTVPDNSTILHVFIHTRPWTKLHRPSGECNTPLPLAPSSQHSLQNDAPRRENDTESIVIVRSGRPRSRVSPRTSRSSCHDLQRRCLEKGMAPETPPSSAKTAVGTIFTGSHVVPISWLAGTARSLAMRTYAAVGTPAEILHPLTGPSTRRRSAQGHPTADPIGALDPQPPPPPYPHRSANPVGRGTATTAVLQGRHSAGHGA